MCYEGYQELEARLQKSEGECYRLYDDLGDSQAECRELKERLNELVIWEKWVEECRKETFQFRVLDKKWWEFLSYYVHIILGKD